MLEFLFFLYLVSGPIKGVLTAYGLQIPLDITFLFGFLALLYSLFREGSNGLTERIQRVYKDGSSLVLFLGAFTAWAFFSTYFISPSVDHAPWKSIAFLTNLVAFGVPLLDRAFRIRVFIDWICSFGLLFGCFTYLAYTFKEMGEPELIGFEQLNYLASLYLSSGLFLGTTAALSLRLGGKKGFLYANALTLLLLATAARGPILFLFVVFGLVGLRYFFLYRRGSVPSLFTDASKRWWGKVLLANLAIIAVIGSSSILRGPFERTAFRFNVLSRSAKEVQGDFLKGDTPGSTKSEKVLDIEPTSSGKRIKEFRFAIRKVIEDPTRFFFGYGFGSFGLYMYCVDQRAYPHNIFLETWFELGLIGVALGSCFFVIAFWRILRKKEYILFFTILFFLLNCMKSSSLTDLRILFGLIAIAVFIPQMAASSRGAYLQEGSTEPPSA